MQARIDALLAAGAQNMWPKFTMYVPRTEHSPAKHVLVAEIMDGICVLTPEGNELLKIKDDIVDAEVVAEVKKPRGVSKPKTPVTVIETVDDLDLDV